MAQRIKAIQFPRLTILRRPRIALLHVDEEYSGLTLPRGHARHPGHGMLSWLQVPKQSLVKADLVPEMYLPKSVKDQWLIWAVPGEGRDQRAKVRVL